MAVVDGSLARKLEFGPPPAELADPGKDAVSMGAPPKLRLAPASRLLNGPDKYKALDHRRHQAQIRARRLLDLVDREG